MYVFYTDRYIINVGTGVAGSTYGGRQYPTYSQNDFHHYDNNVYANCEVDDYSNQENVQSCDLVGLPDLLTSSSYVQSQIAGYVNAMVNLGVAGIRIDAAKHQNSNEMAGYISLLPKDLYINQEVISGSNEAVTPSMYYNLGHVTEFQYSTELDQQFINGDLTYLTTFGEQWGLMPSGTACAFMDNHDTQRNGGALLTYKNESMYYVASAFMLAWPYGDVRVMSSYYFTDTDAGPPGVGVDGGNNWLVLF